MLHRVFIHSGPQVNGDAEDVTARHESSAMDSEDNVTPSYVEHHVPFGTLQRINTRRRAMGLDTYDRCQRIHDAIKNTNDVSTVPWDHRSFLKRYSDARKIRQNTSQRTNANCNHEVFHREKMRKRSDQAHSTCTQVAGVRKTARRDKIGKFEQSLYGNAWYKDAFTSPIPWSSSYFAKRVKPFIRRDYETRPTMMAILDDIRNRHHKLYKKEDVVVNVESHRVVYPLDYCYLQEMHVDAVNDFLVRLFWPGIDVRGAVEYQEFTIVACYRRLIIGCALMNMDGYIMYLAVRPGWQRFGVAQYMLYHLTQTGIELDITLHVSATNPAMLMYQQFGFKPEEYIVNFYAKYVGVHSNECTHAFLLRLKR